MRHLSRIEHIFHVGKNYSEVTMKKCKHATTTGSDYSYVISHWGRDASAHIMNGSNLLFYLIFEACIVHCAIY